MAFPLIVNGFVILLWFFLFLKNRKKALTVVTAGSRTLFSMMAFLLILVGLLGMASSVFTTADLEQFFHGMDGLYGFAIVTLVSSFLQIPGLISIPIAATLYHSGVPASIAAVFITASTMSSVVTFPLETRYLGLRFAVMRITLTLGLCITVGTLTGVILHLFGG